MSVRATSVRAFIYAAAVVLGVAFFSSPPLLGSEKARPIASLTADERAKLPDSTQVTVKSGQTVSLGMLRAEHQARLQRFATAAALGKTAAIKLASHPATPMQIGPAASAKAGSPTAPTGKGAVINKSAQAGSKISMPPSLVPFKLPQYEGKMPKDYVDFCNAANSSLCIYLPPNASLKAGTSWGVDVDYMIIDKDVCDYDGGFLADDIPSCMFYYPYVMTTNFKPTGPLTTAAACDPPFKYALDPRGGIQASYPSFTGRHDTYVFTGGTPATCVVQVWIENK